MFGYESYEAEKIYLGSNIEVVSERKGIRKKVSGLMNKINLDKKGIKIGKKWYSARRLLPCRDNGEIEFHEQDPLIDQPFIQIIYNLK